MATQDPATPDPYLGQVIGKCRLERLVGKGGVGHVYRAVHLTLQRPVAVKILPISPATGAEDVDRFLLEARTVARLEHPNIIQVYDVDEGDGFYYIVMQFIDGDTLRTRLAAAGRLAWPEACRIAREIALGLHVAHSHDPPIVHRDIKPGNVVLGTDGGVRILDFGLVRYLSGASDETRTGRILGTPSYMAPENAQGGSIDQRADIYSLGVTLYFALTGRKPFEGQSSVELIFRHMTETPPPVRELVPEIPEALDELVGQMMAKRPADRPGTCREVAERLAALVDGIRSGPVETPTAPSNGAAPAEEPTMTVGTPRPRTDATESSSISGLAALRMRRNALPPEHETPLLGHERERRTVARRVERALAGEPSLILVTGPDGSGKTRFRYEFARMPETESFVVVGGACDRSTWRTGHDALGELLVQIVDCVEWMSLTLRRTVEDWGSTLLHLAPALADRPFLDGLSRYSQNNPARIKKGLASFLRAVSARCPLAIYLDEFERAAEETWALLAALASEPGLRCLFAVGIREAPAEGSPGHEPCETLSASGRLERLALRPLSEAHVGRLLSSLLGSPHVSAELAREVHFLSGGNPRHVRHVLETGRERGYVFLDGETWTTDLAGRSRYVEDALPAPVEDELLEAAHRLPATHRQVLAILALSPFPLPRSVLETLCAIGVAQVAMISQHLVEARLAVHRTRGKAPAITLTSGRVRARWLEETPVSARPAAYERMAVELERIHGQDPDWAPDLAELFQRAGRFDRTIEWLTAAGRSAASARRFGRAVTFLEEARRLFETTPARKGKRPLTRKGFLPGLFERPVEIEDVYGLLGEAYLALGRSELAARRFEGGTRVASKKTAGVLHRGLGLALIQAGDYDGAARSFRAGQLSGAGDDPEILCHQGLLEAHRDRYDRAAEALERAATRLGEGGEPGLAALVCHTRGRLAYLTGDWDRASELHRREADLLETAGLEFYQPRQAVAWARLLVRRGKVLEAHAILDRIVRRLEDGEGHPMRPAAHDLLGWVYLLEGDPPRAMRAFGRALEAMDKNRDPLQEARLEEGLAAAHLASRRFDLARERCGRCQELYEQVGCRRGKAAGFHLRGRISGAEGKWKGAEKYYGYAQAEIRALAASAPWRAADLDVSLAELALAQGRTREAEAFLKKAFELAWKQGDRPVLARVFRLQGERCRKTGATARADEFFRKALAALR